MDEKLLQTIKELNNLRNKLSALFSLYNASLLQAEENRMNLGGFYEQMVDYKNDLNLITKQIGLVAKAQRTLEYNKNISKINSINDGIDSVSNNFQSACKSYRVALKDCGSLKTEYKQEFSELIKEFKASKNESTQAAIIKGYNQQVHIIKTIFNRIELLIADYNQKRNKVEEDSERFVALKNSVNVILNSLEQIA